MIQISLISEWNLRPRFRKDSWIRLFDYRSQGCCSVKFLGPSMMNCCSHFIVSQPHSRSATTRTTTVFLVIDLPFCGHEHLTSGKNINLRPLEKTTWDLATKIFPAWRTVEPVSGRPVFPEYHWNPRPSSTTVIESNEDLNGCKSCNSSIGYHSQIWFVVKIFFELMIYILVTEQPQSPQNLDWLIILQFLISSVHLIPFSCSRILIHDTIKQVGS